jgi:hypothetical protein
MLVRSTIRASRPRKKPLPAGAGYDLLVLKELAMRRIAYNLIRALMQRAALTYDVGLERLSFKGSLDSLQHFADAIYATHRKPRKQALLFDALLRTIASDLVPLRPNRCKPRVRKRRPKNYQLLTKPRHQMRTAKPVPVNWMGTVRQRNTSTRHTGQVSVR